MAHGRPLSASMMVAHDPDMARIVRGVLQKAGKFDQGQRVRGAG